MVVAVAVVSCLYRQDELFVPRDQKAAALIIDIRHLPGFSAFLRLSSHFLRQGCLAKPLKETDFPGQRPLFPRLLPEILRCQPLQLRQPAGSAETIFPGRSPPRQRRAVREINIIRTLHVHMHDVGRKVLQQRCPVQTLYACRLLQSPLHQRERRVQTKSRMGVVLCPLIAAAVLSVFVQKEIQRPRRLLQELLPLLLCQSILLSGQCRQKNVPGDPRCPVEHLRDAVSHPPEMSGQVRGKNSPLQLGIHVFREKGRNLCQPRPQQLLRKGDGCPRLCREQIQHGPEVPRQRVLHRVPDIAVVRRQAPGGLLQQQPKAVQGLGKEPPPVLAGLRQNQRIHHAEPFKELLLIMHPVPRLREFPVIRQQNFRPLLRQCRLCVPQQLPPIIRRKSFPESPAAAIRQAKAVQDTARHSLRHHMSLCSIPAHLFRLSLPIIFSGYFFRLSLYRSRRNPRNEIFLEREENDQNRDQ